MSRLQREVKKKRPFASLEQEAALNLARTNDRVQIRFERLFRAYGLTPSQYNILRILRGEGKPLPILEIASRMITVVPGITGLIDRLEVAELVCRKRCENDRRVVYVCISDKAVELLGEIDEPLNDLHKALLGHLDPHELSTLSQLLERAREPLVAEAAQL